MELRPGKPEGLVADQDGAIRVDHANAAGIQLQADILETDLFTVLQGHKRLAALKGHRPARFCDRFDDVFMDSRALAASEVRTLLRKADTGVLRAWPAQTGEVVAHNNLWTSGGTVSAVPIETADLHQRAAAGGSQPL